ncbi:MAG: hypothetical protein GY798_34600 [Hyphomicrobiales bacterium]|nr:hypothetical protein [Hyphomicrobiales bacterium]
MRLTLALIAVAVLCATTVNAGEADVVGVVASEDSGGTWRFDVTVRHSDEGWDHYADAWEVRTPDGVVLGTRTLLHPHENEQPFTRSLSGVEIPADVEAVEIRARDSVHGWGGVVETVTLERSPS